MIGEGATLRFQMQLGDKTDDGIKGHISPADNRVPHAIYGCAATGSGYLVTFPQTDRNSTTVRRYFNRRVIIDANFIAVMTICNVLESL